MSLSPLLFTFLDQSYQELSTKLVFSKHLLVAFRVLSIICLFSGSLISGLYFFLNFALFDLSCCFFPDLWASRRCLRTAGWQGHNLPACAGRLQLWVLPLGGNMPFCSQSGLKFSSPWGFNSVGMICFFNLCSVFRMLLEPKAQCQSSVLDLPDLPVSRVFLCLLLPSVPTPAEVLGSLLLPSGVSGCVVDAPQKSGDKPLPVPEPAPAPPQGG